MALFALGAMLLWLVLASVFPLVETHTSDYLVPLVFGIGLSAIWSLRRFAIHAGNSTARPRSTAISSFLSIAALIALLWAGSFSTLNAVLDTHRAQTFKTVVTDTHCYKSTCHWSLKGAPVLPLGRQAMTMEVFLGAQDAQVGDSVVLGIKPGAFGRDWITSREVRHVPRSQLACVRLANAAGRGDTVQLRALLALGLAIETEEPALGCQTPLMTAAKAGQPSTVTLLLDQGANPNHATPGGETPLMNAVTSRQIGVVRLLLTHGADPNAVSHSRGLTRGVMGIALEVGDTGIIRAIGRAMPSKAQ